MSTKITLRAKKESLKKKKLIKCQPVDVSPLYWEIAGIPREFVLNNWKKMFSSQPIAFWMENWK